MSDLTVKQGSDSSQTFGSARSSGDARRVIGTVLVGIFVTTMAQPLGLGELPLRFLLKDRLGLPPHSMALFSAIVLIPFYLKPVAGLISDTWNLGGTRHRHYLLAGSLFGALCWTLLGLLPHTYRIILPLALMVSTALMASGTVIGSLLVEQARRDGMTGRYSALRVLIVGATAAVAGGAGGFLASRPLLLTCAISAVLCIILLGVSYRFVREEPINRVSSEGFTLGDRIKAVFRSRVVWTLGSILALVLVAPGYNTPLFYLQVDHLHFTSPFIGLLTVLSGAAAIVGSALYYYLCRKVRLRFLFLASLVTHVLVTLLYLKYSSPATALFIQPASSLVNVLAVLAAFDAATRAVPAGCEATGYALFISIGNLMYSLSDLSGSWLYDHFHVQFGVLVLLNAATTIFATPLLRFLPANLVDTPDGKPFIQSANEHKA